MVEPLFGEETITITIRINGGINKSKEEFQMEFSPGEKPELKYLLKESCKRFNAKDRSRVAKVYNRYGIELLADDVQCVKADDVLYLALDGEPFNNCAILDDYTIEKEPIGVGGFGTVHLGTHRETGKNFAVKYMDITSTLSSADGVMGIYKEAQSLKSLRHKNIVELYHAFVEGKQLIMIMELAEGGELLKYVGDKGTLKEAEARKILLQIVDAICCCHMRGIVHRDLKLENVMFKA
jgi:hypothetical protein